MRTITLVLLLAGAAAAPAAAQQDRFNWHGRVPAGQTLEIKGINGTVHAVAAGGQDVELTAVKHGHRSNPAEVKVEVVPHAGGVTICSVYPAPSGKPANQCAPGSGGRSETRDNDVNVDYDVRVPAGVKLAVRNVNGAVSAENLTGDIDVQTVNGAVTAAGTGVVRAKTVNGPIDVSMGRADWTGALELQTVNGPVHVALPANASAEVDAQTVNGGLSTDFPLTVQGRFLRSRIQGRIGQGGRQLVLKTVNGAIELRRR